MKKTKQTTNTSQRRGIPQKKRRVFRPLFPHLFLQKKGKNGGSIASTSFGRASLGVVVSFFPQKKKGGERRETQPRQKKRKKKGFKTR